ncbi:MAG: hypothetical protein WCQ72_02685 [Eubacteriales bacterium]
MNKLRLFIIILLIISLSVCSCGKIGGDTATDILSKAISSMPSPPPVGRVYFDGAPYASEQYLSRADASRIYIGASNEAFDMLGLCEDYAVYMSATLEIFEIHILCANSLSGAKTLTHMLEYRAAMLASVNNELYFPDTLDGTPNGGRIEVYVFQSGKYAVLCAGTSAADTQKLLRGFL